jgi:hypothetical protein
MLPPIAKLCRVRVRAGEVVIHAPGFEERTLAIATDLECEVGARAILLDYKPAKPDNRLEEVRATLRQLGAECDDDDIVVYDRFAPGNFEQLLTDRLNSLGTRKAFVDVSTMSKLAIMLVLQVCSRIDIDTTIIYYEADHYGPTESEYLEARENGEIQQPSLHVFNGIHGVVRVDALASVAMQGQPTAAIVFMSFNDALTQLLLNTVYPGRLFLINGAPPIHSWRERAMAWVHEQVRKEWGDDNPVASETPHLPLRATSTLDYRESVSELLSLYWRLSASHRVLIAPSGSKMQTVACYFVKALHPDIHIEYPSPDGFAKEYSTGIGARWALPLGNFGTLLGGIRRVERECFLEIAI